MFESDLTKFLMTYFFFFFLSSIGQFQQNCNKSNKTKCHFFELTYILKQMGVTKKKSRISGKGRERVERFGS